MNTKKQNKKKKGFTLIELIIVIAIIAILAAIAIPNFLGIQRKSKIKADIASAKTIYDATSAAIAEGALVPGNEVTFEFNPDGKIETKTEGSETVTTNTEISGGSDEQNLALSKYIQTIPAPKYIKGKFIVTVEESTGSVKPVINVSIKGSTGDLTPVYPKGTGVYNINSLDGSGTTSEGSK
ncbi:prepilin-type N-terminal cleavage/methylation domain-containing protein [Clostridium perfringens]